MIGATVGNGRSEEMPELHVFHGAAELFELIGKLCRRPQVGDGWPGRSRPGDVSRRGLPMLCLVRPRAHGDVLPVIKNCLKDATPSDIRYSYLDLSAYPELADTASASAEEATEEAAKKAAEEAAERVSRVRQILHDAATGFIRNQTGRRRRLRFERFLLLDWLTQETIANTDHDPDPALRLRLRQRGLTNRIGEWIRNVDDGLHYDKWWWRTLLFLLRLLTVVSFRLAVTGRIPVLSGRYRWFLRQRYLAPKLSGTFVRFAGRLTDGEWQKEDQQSLSLLLVHAFLEDLRRAYRLRPWQVWRRREMAYPILLLDNLTEATGGFLLLSLVNDVRNQTGVFDPLLVISAGEAVPPDAGRDDPDRPHHDAAHARAGYDHWQNCLLADRRQGNDTAWYLPIKIEVSSGKRLEDAVQRWSAFDCYHFAEPQARPVWWLSRWTRIGVPLIVAAVVAATLTGVREQYLHAHCGTGNPDLVWTGAECVGLSDGSFDLFQPSDDTIRQVEATIVAQNRRAEQLHRTDPQRPFITLVVVEGLTSPTGTDTALTDRREAIEGMAVAQLRQLNTTATSAPIVRLLLANAGRDMGEGPRLVEPLRNLARRDPSVVGIVGLDQSRRSVADIIAAISTIGLPMVSSTLSADRLADLYPLYFQVAPQNRREAEIAAAFAENLPAPAGSAPVQPRQVRIYYSDDPDDLYSNNLRDDARASFAEHGFAVDTVAFGSTGNQHNGDRWLADAAAAGRDTCSYDGVAFYAGRGSDFDEFASGASGCGSKAVLIGDDDVSAHVADETARHHVRAIPYYYISFADAPIDKPTGVASDFYETLQNLFPFEQTTRGRSFDGYGALAYDAGQVIITAAGYLHDSVPPIPLTAGTVWRQITTIHSSLSTADQTDKAIDGVTGTIDYGGDITRHVPLDKPIAVLRVDNGEVDMTFQKFCGTPTSHQTPEPWCPHTP